MLFPVQHGCIISMQVPFEVLFFKRSSVSACSRLGMSWLPEAEAEADADADADAEADAEADAGADSNTLVTSVAVADSPDKSKFRRFCEGSMKFGAAGLTKPGCSAMRFKPCTTLGCVIHSPCEPWSNL